MDRTTERAVAQAVEQIIIDRPVGTVWALHTQPSMIPRISVNTVKYEPRGPMKVGTRIDGATKVVGRTVEWEAGEELGGHTPAFAGVKELA